MRVENVRPQHSTAEMMSVNRADSKRGADDAGLSSVVVDLGFAELSFFFSVTEGRFVLPSDAWLVDSSSGGEIV